MELSIDTSNRHASIALSEKGKLIIDKTWISNKNHSVELLPSINKLLTTNGKKFPDIKCLFIAKGPGKFSSLRVGMSIAKGLSFSLKIPIIAINTLYMEAYPELEQNSKTYSLMEYNKDKLYIGQFNNLSEEIESKYSIISQEQLYYQISENSFVCGEGISSLQNEFYDKLKTKTKFIKLKLPGTRIKQLAKLGFKNYKNKKYSNTSTLQPIYLGNSQINNAKNNN